MPTKPKLKYDPNNVPFQVQSLIDDFKIAKGYHADIYKIRLQDIVAAITETLDSKTSKK